MPGMKKYQEGGRVRAGNPGMTSAEKSRRRESMSRLEDKIRREEEDAQSMAIAERATGGRYQDPPMPRRAEAADLTAGDAAAGNPRGVSLSQHFGGPMRSGRIYGEDPRLGGDFSIGRKRNKAYARADQAAMQEDVDREVRRRMSKEPAFKKGGMVKKAAGGMVTHMGPGSGNAPPAAGFPRMDRRPNLGQLDSRPVAMPPTDTGRRKPGRGPGPDFGAADGPRGGRPMPMSRRMKTGGVVKKAKGGMIGKGCK
jgi:hypothetical protein